MTQVTIELPDTKEEADEMANEFLNFWQSLGYPREASALQFLYIHMLCGNEMKIETFRNHMGLNFCLAEPIKPKQEARNELPE